MRFLACWKAVGGLGFHGGDITNMFSAKQLADMILEAEQEHKCNYMPRLSCLPSGTKVVSALKPFKMKHA
jgi:hypothetical protein